MSKNTRKSSPLPKEVCAAILDKIDACVCVLDAESDAVIFASSSFRAAFGEACPERNGKFPIPSDKTRSTGEGDFELSLDGGEQWLIRMETIPWAERGQARLLICRKHPGGQAGAGLQERVLTDYLTGLSNRQACDEELSRMLKNLHTVKTPAYLFFIDLDDFKIVNDSFGHDYGDGVLVAFAEFLKRVFHGKNLVFRLGGDEFVVIVDFSNGFHVPEYLEELLERARRPWNSLDKEFYCSLSIGVVEFIAQLESPRSVLKKADLAMYQAKKMGKNNYAYYTEGLDADTITRSEIENLLRRAMENDFSGFEILYQPYYRLNPQSSRRLELAGGEALLRLRDRDGKFILPKDFIGLAEYLGLIIPIGDHVLRRVTSFCRQINESGHKDFTLSINLSAAQFKQKNVVQKFKGILRDSGVNLRNIIVGINEGTALSERKSTLEYCAEFRRQGMQVVMDDFGSGSSSFINMRNLPVDIIKISPMYLHAYTDEFAGHFIKLVSDLGHYSGKEICLSGVETEPQLEFCMDMGADMVQGFLLNSPGSADKLLRELV
ncbi:MAG: bifunctional diguanylate cyclase/phosphodiesterase [Deltaproteobacteria bacterium]|nr:bifunctional diguanylate cyclase/phosphodiesterase [Deltaproteobacteria bacterium]